MLRTVAILLLQNIGLIIYFERYLKDIKMVLVNYIVKQ